MDTLEEFELFDRADAREWQRRYMTMVDNATLMHRELMNERERGRRRYNHGVHDATALMAIIWVIWECVRAVL